MDPWRLATKAQRRINAVAGLALAGCVLAWLAGFGSASTQHIDASVEHAGAKSIVERHEPSPVASTEPAAMPQATVVADAAAADVEMATAPDAAVPAVSTIEINEECLVAEICIDRYLWALYERAPKVDAIKVYEQRKVTIKRKGKTKTVTRTFTRRVDEDFTWKDPKAAEKAGMAMMD